MTDLLFLFGQLSPQITSTYADIKQDGCLGNIYLTFNTKTNVPPVDLQQDLDHLLSFDPPELNSVPHHGFWESYSRFKVSFSECLEWDWLMEKQRGQPMLVIFETVTGECRSINICV